MTELNNEVRELTVDELDGVSGGSLWDIMKAAADSGSGMERIANHAVWGDGQKRWWILFPGLGLTAGAFFFSAALVGGFFFVQTGSPELAALPLIVRMRPNIRRDFALLGQLDHVDGPRVSSLFRWSAF
jgi:hypothetical protein